jgi:hypothetical protein
LTNFVASAFKPASSVGQVAAGVALVAAAGDAGAVACAKSGAQKRAGAINDARKNDVQMRVVFMRTLYQIQPNTCRAFAKYARQFSTHWNMDYSYPSHVASHLPIH